MTTSFKQYYAGKQKVINQKLKTLLNHRKVPKRLKEAMNYSLNAGGKRLRPVLCLMVDDVLRGQFDTHHSKDIYRLALALECVHTYSLIHDDLPSMDDDDLRRGKPTCHIKYDEATAILAGDSLLTFAFGSLGELENVKPVKLLQNLILTLTSSSGAEGMAGGQMLDIEADGKNNGAKKKINIRALKKIHELKNRRLN